MQFDLEGHLRTQAFLAKLSTFNNVSRGYEKTQNQPQLIISSKRSTPKRHNSEARNETKFDEKVRRIVMTLCSHRKRLKYDQVYKYATDIIKTYSIKPDRGRESTLVNILFSVIYGCRKHGIYIDPLLVSGEIDFSYKKLIKNIFNILPYTSSKSEYDIEMSNNLITPDINAVCKEYVDVIMRGDETVLAHITQRSQYIYDLIEKTNVLTTEKQFCVTPSKIVAYSIMEYDKSSIIHEKLKFPKLFFEKIKRVVNRAERLNKDQQ